MTSPAIPPPAMAQTLPATPPPRVPSAPAFAPPPPVQQTFAPPPPAFGAPAFAAPTMTAPAPMSPVVRPPPGLPGGAPIYGTAMAPPAGFQQVMAESVDEIGGTRAVEVAAMLGDSVINVKHCIDPRGGKISPVTYAMFAIGVFTLLASAFAFYQSVDNAAFNKGKYDAETTCSVHGNPIPNCVKKPGYAVRPRML